MPTKNNREKSKIIFLKNGEIETLDISQAEHQILLRKNRLNSLSKLLIALEASAASPDEVQLLFTKWTENEILFFLKNEPGFSLAP
ncbi:MAG: hypothetical protein KDD38_08225 [Bdellovibrionales bacterium]|nr:hypothetical protein [Bdellovibrionales bacterium]